MRTLGHLDMLGEGGGVTAGGTGDRVDRPQYCNTLWRGPTRTLFVIHKTYSSKKLNKYSNLSACEFHAKKVRLGSHGVQGNNTCVSYAMTYMMMPTHRPSWRANKYIPRYEVIFTDMTGSTLTVSYITIVWYKISHMFPMELDL